MKETHVVAVCGSLRDESRTRDALEVAIDSVRDVGGTGEVLDLRAYDLPVFDGDEDEQGDSDAIVEKIGAADALILGTPTYHGSYSGVLKNALDYCGFDEFEGTTVGLVSVAGGSFPVRALDDLRSVCRTLDAWVLPYEAAIPNVSNAFEDGELVDEDVRERLQILGRRTVQYADIEPDPATWESKQNVGTDR